MLYKLETEDMNEHLFAIHGLSWALVVWDMDQKLRELSKYPSSTRTDNELKLIQEIRDVLHCYIDDRGVSLEDII